MFAFVIRFLIASQSVQEIGWKNVFKMIHIVFSAT